MTQKKSKKATLWARAHSWLGHSLEPSVARLWPRLASKIERLFGGPLVTSPQSGVDIEASATLLRKVGTLFADGIVSNWGRVAIQSDCPRMPSFFFRLAPLTHPQREPWYFMGRPSGAGENDEEALVRATSEAIERHSLAVYDKQDFRYGAYDELAAAGAVNPLRFSPLSAAQLKKISDRSRYEVSADSKFAWARGRALKDGSQVLVPAQLAYLAYERGVSEPFIREMTTNGAGAGQNWNEAVCSGICEALERDAFFIHWLNRIAPPQIPHELIRDSRSQRLLSLYHRYRLEVWLFDITTDYGIPTAMVVVLDRSGVGPAVHVATDCDTDPKKAIYDALLSPIQVSPWGRKIDSRTGPLDPAKIQTFEERERFWAPIEKINDIKWIFSNRKRTGFTYPSITNPQWKLQKLRSTLAEKESDCFIVDVTTSIARRLGITVVIALLPELYPLYLGERNRYLGVPRLYEAPVKMGVFEEPKTEAEMNPTPHPFL